MLVGEQITNHRRRGSKLKGNIDVCGAGWEFAVADTTQPAAMTRSSQTATQSRIALPAIEAPDIGLMSRPVLPAAWRMFACRRVLRAGYFWIY
ncbi:hypothetical protein I546_2673 [Mycobacterium kansasii 732]|nr:hypothetical protein I546_2673 [Mycobacterium kansasii 732]